MATNFQQEGSQVKVVLAAAATAGDIVVQGNLRGVAQMAGAIGDTILLHLDGVHVLTKKTGTAWTQGVALYWDATPGEVTTVAADGSYIGDAFAAASSGATTGEVLLRAPGTDSTGVEIQASKDASGGYAGLTLFKINLKNAAGAFLSTIASTATAARAWAFPDKDGTIALTNDFGKSTATLVSGTRTIANTSIGPASAVAVQKVSLGGTVAAGGYKVALNAGVGYTITALQADGTTTETGNTDSVQIIIIY